jgi:hypothetical protein
LELACGVVLAVSPVKVAEHADLRDGGKHQEYST